MNIDESELIEVFQSIKDVINENSFSSFLLCGDINCDFLRNSGHVRCVNNFLGELSLVRSWDSFEVDFTYCSELEEDLHLSTLDHLFWNGYLTNQVSDAGVLHSLDNDSDHSAIYCVVKLQPEQLKSSTRPPGYKKPSWARSSQDDKENFRSYLRDRLDLLTIPQSAQSCKDVHCRDVNHQNEVDQYMTEILNCMEMVSFESLPVSKPSSLSQRKKSKPGWTDQVKEREISIIISIKNVLNLKPLLKRIKFLTPVLMGKVIFSKK